jgi:hypothetical protein
MRRRNTTRAILIDPEKRTVSRKFPGFRTGSHPAHDIFKWDLDAPIIDGASENEAYALLLPSYASQQLLLGSMF